MCCVRIIKFLAVCCLIVIGLLQVMSSIDELHVFLGRDCLPSELGGLLQYDHDAWFHRCQVSTCCRWLLFRLMWSSAMDSLLFSETVRNLMAYFLLDYWTTLCIITSMLYIIKHYIISCHICCLLMIVCVLLMRDRCHTFARCCQNHCS